MAAIVLLGFSSGLPLYLTSRTLQAWMTVAGVSLRDIGLFSLLSLPYSLKFLWSPAMDGFTLPLLGRRKGWLFATQMALAIAIGAMAFQRPAQALQFVAINAFAIAFLSATQDITIDAYTVDISTVPEVGAASGAKVLGYRIAMIATGAGALVMAARYSWPAVYLTCGLLMLSLSIFCMHVPEPALRDRPGTSMREAVRMPLIDFFVRTGRAGGISILAFIMLYRLGDAMISNMTTSFLLQTGFSQTDIGVIQGGIGLFATIVGVLAGGVVVNKIGIYRSLWVFGILQAGSNLAYLLLAYLGRNYPFMIATIIIENFCTGLGTASLVGFLMTLCNPRFSATQYALLSSLMAVGRDVLAAPSGSIAEKTGWPGFFVISVFAAVPGMALLPYLPQGKAPQEAQEAQGRRQFLLVPLVLLVVPFGFLFNTGPC
jgi:PAT family beta-lactamase induction signal transducer AmpG